MALDKAFTVEVNSVNNPVEEVDVGGSGVTLRVQNRIEFGDTITVSYTVPADSKITDIFGNELAAFADLAVDNARPDPSDTDPPMLDGAETDKEGREISINFDEDIVAAIPPNPVINLNELDSGADTGNENRFYIEWRWSPGQETDDNARDYYQYRYRQVTNPVSAWSDWVRNETGSARIGNLLPNATYEIEVVATNVGGDSTGVTDQADTPVVSSGLAPTNFQVTSKGRILDGANYKYAANFSYTRDSTDTAPLTRYEYRYKKTAANAWSGWADNGTNLTFTIDAFERNVSYDVEVRLVNFIGASDAASVTDTITFNAPDGLTNFAAAGSRTGSSGSYGYQLNLTWDAPADDDTKTVDSIRYRYKASTATNFGAWVTLANTATSTAITGLAHTTLYDVELESVNNVGSGTAATADDLAAFTKPGPVTMLTCVFTRLTNRTNNVTYSWDLPAANPVNTVDEVLTRVRKTTDAWGAFVSQAADYNTETVTNATDNSTYEIEVKTKNNVGESAVVTASCDVQVLGPGPTVECFINLAAYLVQVVASGWEIPATKSIEWEYHLGGETAWRPLGIKDVSTLGEFEIVLVNTRWSEGSLPQGTTLAGSRARLRGLDENGDPITEWSIATAVEQ